jgi:hypothetical protein
MESSQNKNVMIIDGENEIGLNEWNMENEIMNGDLEIKQNITKEITNPNENNEMKNLKTLHIHRKKWRGHNKMQFVGLFIMQMMINKFISKIFKS